MKEEKNEKGICGYVEIVTDIDGSVIKKEVKSKFGESDNMAEIILEEEYTKIEQYKDSLLVMFYDIKSDRLGGVGETVECDNEFVIRQIVVIQNNYKEFTRRGVCRGWITREDFEDLYDEEFEYPR